MAVIVEFFRKIAKLQTSRNLFLLILLCSTPSYLFAESNITTADFESELETTVWESELKSKNSFPKDPDSHKIFSQNQTQAAPQVSSLPAHSEMEADWENEERDLVSEIITLQKQVQSDFHKEMAGLQTASFLPESDSESSPYFYSSKVLLISGSDKFEPSFVRITNTRKPFDSQNQTLGFRSICPNLSIPNRFLQFLAIKLNSPPPGFPKQVRT
ncbi:hypothetical protein LPTSP3_g05950 [Leptospira kobayashii]|uniref:Uncharacterized protein n=1 Tax=Leptospira kobayashii TaxID=1917830 RepID=A0ABN6KAT0_9LEPT|nr:hypothetical protein [Leptospira kobayashii]BDA77665.1 hypothetical protein LPTSP3_g05950 [Leptospira kobayashii]